MALPYARTTISRNIPFSAKDSCPLLQPLLQSPCSFPVPVSVPLNKIDSRESNCVSTVVDLNMPSKHAHLTTYNQNYIPRLLKWWRPPCGESLYFDLQLMFHSSSSNTSLRICFHFRSPDRELHWPGHHHQTAAVSSPSPSAIVGVCYPIILGLP